MKKPIKIESIEINLITPREFVTIWKDGEYINPTEGDLIEMFEAESFHYASVLEGSFEFHAFNTSIMEVLLYYVESIQRNSNWL